LNEIKTDRDSLKKEFKPFKEAGLTDINDVLTKLSDYDKLKEIDPEKEAGKLVAERVDVVNREWTKKYNEDINVKTSENDKLIGQLRNMKIDDAIRDAADKTQANTLLITPIIKQHIRFNEDGNIYIKDPIKNSPELDKIGKNLDLRGKFEQMREDPNYMPLFHGTGNAGSGSKGQPAPVMGSNGKIRIRRNDQEAKNKYISEIAKGNVEFLD